MNKFTKLGFTNYNDDELSNNSGLLSLVLHD
jgi:hypothetical protein